MKENSKITDKQRTERAKALTAITKKILTDNEACIISVMGKEKTETLISGKIGDLLIIHSELGKKIMRAANCDN